MRARWAFALAACAVLLVGAGLVFWPRGIDATPQPARETGTAAPCAVAYAPGPSDGLTVSSAGGGAVHVFRQVNGSFVLVWNGSLAEPASFPLGGVGGLYRVVCVSSAGAQARYAFVGAASVRIAPSLEALARMLEDSS